jgi:competence CoiA-like predicted nuclease
MTNFLSIYNTKSESFYHKAIKRFLFKYISDFNKNITEKSLEKYIGKRRADVYFKLTSGEELVIEVQNSKLSINEIIERTKYYNDAGLYVLWILYGNGACVASPKNAEDKVNIKVSRVENFLFRMYGGRVYYVNLNFYKDKITISPPYALYFSLSSNRKNQKKFQGRYEHYYIKNANYTNIQSWNLLCVTYNDFRLARFYDKNIKRVLKEKIYSYYKEKRKNIKSDKKLFRSILKHFETKYGIYLILQSYFELHQTKIIKLSPKIIKKIKRKIST